MLYFLREHGWDAFRVPVSGAAAAIKGDVIARKNGMRLRIDAKSTSSTSRIRISTADITKNIQHARDEEIPVIVFSFKRHRNLYAILQARYAELFHNCSVAEAKSSKSVLFKKEEVQEVTARRSCMYIKLKGGKRYTVARFEDFLTAVAER